MTERSSYSPLKIVYETENEWVVYKPKGIACEKRIDDKRESLVSILTDTMKAPVYLPHRLDAVTAGLVLVARSKEAVAFHNKQIAAREWKKFYIAKVDWANHLSPDHFIGTHKAFLKRKGNRSLVVKSGGAPSFLKILAIEKVNDAPNQRHVLIKLLTGRYHQIRVMCLNLGIPLCGDLLYATASDPSKLFYLEHTAIGFKEMSSGEWRIIITPQKQLAENVCDSLYEKLMQEAL